MAFGSPTQSNTGDITDLITELVVSLVWGFSGPMTFPTAAALAVAFFQLPFMGEEASEISHFLGAR